MTLVSCGYRLYILYKHASSDSCCSVGRLCKVHLAVTRCTCTLHVHVLRSRIGVYMYMYVAKIVSVYTQ